MTLAPLLWLAFGAFAIGTEGFVIAGLLPGLARDLGVSIAAAGQLVTAFALTYAVGGPVLSVATASVDRKRLLAGSLAVFLGGNLLAAFAGGYWQLLAARLAMALAAATFMPAASAYAAAAAPPERRGRALSIIYGGLTLAVAVGSPLGVAVGERYGWRRTFLAVAGLSALAGLGLRSLPRAAPAATPTLAERLAAGRRPDVLAVLASTALVLAGLFTFYTYLAPFLGVAGGLRGQGVALVLFVFGLGGVAGNLLGGAAADRWGPRRVVAALPVVLVAIFASLSLAAQALPPATALPVIVALVALWGLAGFAFPAAQQSRLVRLDSRLAPITLSLNASATYAGITVGALLGSLVIRRGQVAALGWAAAACQAAALGLVVLTARATAEAFGVRAGAQEGADPAANDALLKPGPARDEAA